MNTNIAFGSTSDLFPGAEVVQANLDDPSTLLDAVSGCHGVFGVTNYNEFYDKAREVKQVGNINMSKKGASW